MYDGFHGYPFTSNLLYFRFKNANFSINKVGSDFLPVFRFGKSMLTDQDVKTLHSG